jgi:hypothetical protein
MNIQSAIEQVKQDCLANQPVPITIMLDLGLDGVERESHALEVDAMPDMSEMYQIGQHIGSVTSGLSILRTAIIRTCKAHVHVLRESDLRETSMRELEVLTIIVAADGSIDIEVYELLKRGDGTVHDLLPIRPDDVLQTKALREHFAALADGFQHPSAHQDTVELPTVTIDLNHPGRVPHCPYHDRAQNLGALLAALQIAFTNMKCAHRDGRHDLCEHFQQSCLEAQLRLITFLYPDASKETLINDIFMPIQEGYSAVMHAAHHPKEGTVL